MKSPEILRFLAHRAVHREGLLWWHAAQRPLQQRRGDEGGRFHWGAIPDEGKDKLFSSFIGNVIPLNPFLGTQNMMLFVFFGSHLNDRDGEAYMKSSEAENLRIETRIIGIELRKNETELNNRYLTSTKWD